MKTFLCLIVEVDTGREIKEYEIEARDEFFVKSEAVIKFAEDRKYLPKKDRTCKYKVEICEVDWE